MTINESAMEASTWLGGEEGVSPTGDKQKVYSCSRCKYETDRKNNLKRHVVTMHDPAPSLLDCCGIRFSTKGELRDHTRAVHGAGYTCWQCGHTFCRRALLHRHQAVHSGLKAFSCTKCGYQSSHKSNMQRHMLVHTQMKHATRINEKMIWKSATSEKELNLNRVSMPCKQFPITFKNINSSNGEDYPHRLFHTKDPFPSLNSSSSFKPSAFCPVLPVANAATSTDVYAASNHIVPSVPAPYRRRHHLVQRPIPTYRKIQTDFSVHNLLGRYGNNVARHGNNVARHGNNVARHGSEISECTKDFRKFEDKLASSEYFIGALEDIKMRDCFPLQSDSTNLGHCDETVDSNQPVDLSVKTYERDVGTTTNCRGNVHGRNKTTSAHSKDTSEDEGATSIDHLTEVSTTSREFNETSRNVGRTSNAYKDTSTNFGRTSIAYEVPSTDFERTSTRYNETSKDINMTSLGCEDTSKDSKSILSNELSYINELNTTSNQYTSSNTIWTSTRSIVTSETFLEIPKRLLDLSESMTTKISSRVSFHDVNSLVLDNTLNESYRMEDLPIDYSIKKRLIESADVTSDVLYLPKKLRAVNRS